MPYSVSIPITRRTLTWAAYGPSPPNERLHLALTYADNCRMRTSRYPLLRTKVLTTVLTTVLSAVSGWGVLAPTATRTPDIPRPALASWMWGRPDPQSAIAFAQQHGVRELYVEVAATVLTDGDLPRLQRLARLAASAGIRLLALGGEPMWTTSPQMALNWQRTVLSTGLFAGSHVDVEPYALPGWSRRQPQRTLVKQYLSLLDRLQAADRRPLEVDVPFWFQTIASPTGRTTLADDVLGLVDAVTVMSYRDSAAGILNVGADLLQRSGAIAAATGRQVPVRLSAETTAQPDCRYCTFFEEGAGALKQAALAVDASAACMPAYAGFAVHDYAGWSRLRP